ncbi:MAG TPA: hypothetical protein VNG33_10335, partial [Polyangiaceae bacterium]|nr:hypothetical protein [Polyangiaceae bacterium]
MWSKLSASACALLFSVAIYAAARLHLGGIFGGYPTMLLFGGTSLAAPWLSAERRLNVVLAASILCGVSLLHWYIPIPLLLTWGIVKVSRLPWSSTRKLTVLLGSWLLFAFAAWIAIPYTGYDYAWVTTWLGFLPAAMIWLVI